MKKRIHLLMVSFIVVATMYSQSNNTSFGFKFTGSSRAFQKGSENTELLSEIIQEKQEQIKERVFKNTVIKLFNKSKNSYTKKLNNFTTYNYLYNVMDVLTSGKNKKNITNVLMESSAEFAFIFGLAYYTNKDLVTSYGVTYSKNGKIKIPKNIKEFNLLIDLCYDVFIKHKDEFQTEFKFKESLENVSFKTWYTTDNVYLQEYNKAVKNKDSVRIKELTSQKKFIKEKVQAILLLGSNTSQVLKTINNHDFKGAKTRVGKLSEDFFSLTSTEIKDEVDDLKLTFGNDLSDEQNQLLDKLKNFANEDFDEYKELYSFYTNLRKNKFEDFSINNNQLNALKFLLSKFVKVARNHHPNDIIALIVDFLIKNMVVEHDNSELNSHYGYLYLNSESIITEVETHFSHSKKKRVNNYIAPFFSLGTNYGTFNKSNQLKSDKTSLNHLYFASEKIGFRFKIYNWKYTRSFKPGESFKYHGKHRVWHTPQEQPLISDVHFLVYGSGILYNVVNTKSEKSFNHPLIGYGFGITFFNGLSMNISYGNAIVNKSIRSTNSFINIGFDIPILEYILPKKQ